MFDDWRIRCPWIPQIPKFDHIFPNKHGNKLAISVGRLTSFSPGAAACGKRLAEQVRMTRAWDEIWMESAGNSSSSVWEQWFPDFVLSILLTVKTKWPDSSLVLTSVSGTMEPAPYWRFCNAARTASSYQISPNFASLQATGSFEIRRRDFGLL